MFIIHSNLVEYKVLKVSMGNNNSSCPIEEYSNAVSRFKIFVKIITSSKTVHLEVRRHYTVKTIKKMLHKIKG